MTGRQQCAMLPGGRLHLQDGPIDLILSADGAPDAVRAAFDAATARFARVLDELCAELTGLRARVGTARLDGPIARRMAAAVAPFAQAGFITPMAAVAGAVAEDILRAMTAAAPLARAAVNNGGDIALHLAPGQSFRIGLVDRPDRPSLFGRVTLAAVDRVRGVATSGWRGRSFSRGIADAVTVLAASAAMADAAATVIANAVDLPGHPGILRAPAVSLQPDSDLGDRLVTRTVPALVPADIEAALSAGIACAKNLAARGLIVDAALNLQGRTVTIGQGTATPMLALRPACGENVRDSGDEGRLVPRPSSGPSATFFPRAGSPVGRRAAQPKALCHA